MLIATSILALLAAAPEGVPAQDGRGAASSFSRSADTREGALDSFTNAGTDDSGALLKHLQQEIYTTQQLVILTQFRLDHAERIRLATVFVDSGGELIPTHVFTPAKENSGARHPAVVMVHGGFHERLEPSWFPLIETVVEAGYIVLFPEYRGSRGYGDAIYQNDYGNTDVADVLAAGRYAAGRPDIDPARIGILGQSRGGMVTLLAIERAPKQFRAAVDIVGLTDFVAYMSYKPDYRRREIAETNPGFKGKLPHENLPAYIDVSPINFVERIEAPVLVLATSGDKIVPHTLHTGRLIDALKANGKTHEAKIYDNAPGGHVFMKGATPERDDALRRIVAWFDRWLGAVP